MGDALLAVYDSKYPLCTTAAGLCRICQILFASFFNFKDDAPVQIGEESEEADGSLAMRNLKFSDVEGCNWYREQYEAYIRNNL